MKLEKSDVRAVANSRYWSSRRSGLLFLVVILTACASTALVCLTESALSLLILVPLLAYFLIVTKNAGKYQRELLRQWESEQK